MMPGPAQPLASRLAIRFAIILALALLPAGFISLVQTWALEGEVNGRGQAALFGATLQAASAETNLMARVQGMVGSLAAAVPALVDDTAACVELMDGIAKAEPLASVVAFVPVSGLMTCASKGRVHDFSHDPLFRKVRDIEAPYFWVNPYGPVAETAVLGTSQPVYSRDGKYLGYAVITVSQASLDQLRYESLTIVGGLRAPAIFWTFDREGTVLTANVDAEAVAENLPASKRLQDFLGSQAQAFQAVAASGRQMTYALVPIVSGELYLMSGFLTDGATGSFVDRASPYIPTLIMWFVGLLGAAVAAEFLVTRYVRTLHRSIVAFARGDRRLLTLDLKNAPFELDELALAYSSMTESVTRSEAELEDLVHQKEVLLREVHHRVKNNLQLISSIMNIQIRSTRSEEARDLLKNLQERIMSLATVHRGLYQTSGLADVRARELIPDITRQIMAISSGPEKPFTVVNDIDDLRLVPDQAVPLSLLLAEALTNALKHAGATRDHPGKLTVRLKRSGGGDAVLEVVNSTRDHGARVAVGVAPNTGIGSQLITAFVQQLSGKLDSGEVDGDYHLKVTFEVSPLSTAEQRQAHLPFDAAERNLARV
jgi:two-component system, sensor histidine kinase PdtaS